MHIHLNKHNTYAISYSEQLMGANIIVVLSLVYHRFVTYHKIPNFDIIKIIEIQMLWINVIYIYIYIYLLLQFSKIYEKLFFKLLLYFINNIQF